MAKAPQTLDEQADAIVREMSLTEKVGQMVMIGVQGTDVTDDSLYMLHQYHMGGVILFDRNMESADQTKKLIADLQAKADQKVPLFIGVDEEGGQVVRGKSFLTPPPSEQEIGRSGEVTRAEESARQTAEKLKKLGFNVNFAPVADVGEYARSFSADPEQAAKFVEAAAQGYEQQHMMYALKHFPGIGRGTVDSHEDISSITATKAELRSSKSIKMMRNPISAGSVAGNFAVNICTRTRVSPMRKKGEMFAFIWASTAEPPYVS